MRKVIWVAYDEHGNLAADTDRDSALDQLSRRHGPSACRVACIYVTIPRITDVELNVDIPQGAQEPAPIVETG